MYAQHTSLFGEHGGDAEGPPGVDDDDPDPQNKVGVGLTVVPPSFVVVPLEPLLLLLLLVLLVLLVLDVDDVLLDVPLPDEEDDDDVDDALPLAPGAPLVDPLELAPGSVGLVEVSSGVPSKSVFVAPPHATASKTRDVEAVASKNLSRSVITPEQ